MILLDAVFIIEFLKENKHPKNFEPRMMFDIKEDQLPFSIIWDIYYKINRVFLDQHGNLLFLIMVTDAFGKNTSRKNTARPFLDCGSIERGYSFDPVKLKYSVVMLQGRSEVSGHPRQMFGQHNI
uniref:Uncharacterized protein n=1 Tax=Salix viminalis TaxID=40686 RepID=A0A6N2L102_SALVM